MASLKALCLAGVVSLAATATTAHAADLLPPPLPPAPPVEAPLLQAPAIGGGWYLRGDVGAGLTQLSDESSSFDSPVPDFASQGSFLANTPIVDLGVGYQLNNWFRADVTGEYRFDARYSAFESYSGSPNCPTTSGYYCVDGYTGSISNAVFLANGYVQLGTWYGATPYIDGGVGVAINMFHGLTDYGITNSGAYGTATDHSSTHFAWAAGAGVSYALTANIALDLSYRYLDMGKIVSGPIVCNQNGGCPHEVQSYKLAANDIRLGLRYTFANFVPYAPPPLVAKY